MEQNRKNLAENWGDRTPQGGCKATSCQWRGLGAQRYGARAARVEVKVWAVEIQLPSQKIALISF